MLNGMGLDMPKVESLLMAMREQSRPVKHARLGIIGGRRRVPISVEARRNQASADCYGQSDIGATSSGVPFFR